MDTRLGVDILSNSGRTRLHIDIMSKLKTPIGLVHETAPRSRSPPLRDQIRYMPAWAAGIYPAVVDETRGIRPRVSHRPDLLNYEGHNPNWNPIPSREVASRTWSSSPKAREDRRGSYRAGGSAIAMSALPTKADICSAISNVRFVSLASASRLRSR